MVKWQALHVPYLEGPIAARLGAEYNQRVYWCTATRFRSRDFKRWRDANSWVRVTIYPGDGRRAREEARANRCLWDPKAFQWYVEYTDASSLRPWHRARMQPPGAAGGAVVHELRGLVFAENEKAKHAGARWSPSKRCWVFACYGEPPRWVTNRLGVTCPPAGSAAPAAASAPGAPAPPAVV